VRGAFEYQGQKCSAASRAYIPRSIWSDFRDRLVAEIRQIKMGDPRDFRNFMNAVIDEGAFTTISDYIEFAKAQPDAEILCGGECDKRQGYFIQPTVVTTTNPSFKTLVEEIFGPVLTVFVYDDDQLDETLQLCDSASAYALTGAVFAQDLTHKAPRQSERIAILGRLVAFALARDAAGWGQVTSDAHVEAFMTQHI